MKIELRKRALALGLTALVLSAMPACGIADGAVGPVGDDLEPSLVPSSAAATSPSTQASPGAGPMETLDPKPPVGAPPPHLGGSAHNEFPGDADLTDGKPAQAGDRTVNSTIKVNHGLTLRDGWFHATDNWSETELHEGDISDGSGAYVIKGWAPGYVAKWQIYNTEAKPTDYWIGIKFYTPVVGANRWSCVIYKGDPMGEGVPTNTSEFTCAWTNVRGGNPKPILTVDQGTMITNKRDAKAILKQYCTGTNAGQACRFADFGLDKAVVGPPTMVGSSVTNTGETVSKRTIEWATTVTTSDSVGVELSTEVELFEIWTAEIKTSYKHTWELETEFKEGTEIEIEPESIGWISFEPMMQVSKGTWVVNAGGKVYLLPEISIAGALRDGGKIYTNGCLLADYKDGVCTKPMKRIEVG